MQSCLDNTIPSWSVLSQIASAKGPISDAQFHEFLGYPLGGTKQSNSQPGTLKIMIRRKLIVAIAPSHLYWYVKNPSSITWNGWVLTDPNAQVARRHGNYLFAANLYLATNLTFLDRPRDLSTW